MALTWHCNKINAQFAQLLAHNDGNPPDSLLRLIYFELEKLSSASLRHVCQPVHALASVLATQVLLALQNPDISTNPGWQTAALELLQHLNDEVRDACHGATEPHPPGGPDKQPCLPG